MITSIPQMQHASVAHNFLIIREWANEGIRHQPDHGQFLPIPILDLLQQGPILQLTHLLPSS